MLQFYAMTSSGNEKRIYVEEQDLIMDGFRLGRQIFKSEFHPDFIVGVWRGGSAVGIVVQECLQYLGLKTDHISIRTSYQSMLQYPDMVRNSDQIRVHGLEYLVEHLQHENRLLLVDDVFSSGYSMQAVRDRLSLELRRNLPCDIRVAAVWYRPVANRPAPDYFVNRTDCWLVLPYELSGLDLEDIRAHKSWAASILETIEAKDS